MPIDLYYSLHSPFCRSVLLVARALGIELNPLEVFVKSGDSRTETLFKNNPQHIVPTIDDNGFILWESRAILGYLVNQYGKDDSLYPKDPKKRAIVDQRLYFDIGTLFPRLEQCFVAFRKGQRPEAEKLAKLDEAIEFLNKFLEGHDWLAGSHITIADFALVVTVSFTEVLGIDISKHQNVARWFSKAKETIEGYSEIQDAGNAELRKLIGHATTHN